jgi:hypothetical protein
MMLSCENRGASLFAGRARDATEGRVTRLRYRCRVNTRATKMPALAVARASRSHSPGWRMGEGCTAPQGGAIRIPPVVLPR